MVECTVVTHMFSKEISTNKDGSISSGTSFELRPQSVKGVLHYWFRAVAPRVIDITKLNLQNAPKSQREEIEKTYGKSKYPGLMYFEELLFGSQKQKAPFSISVSYDKNSQNLQRLPVNTNNDLNLGNYAHKYALYGLTYKLNKQDREEYLVEHLKPGNKINLEFLVQDEETWNAILSLLKLVSVLSGFGAKTTKGFGEFEIVKFTGQKQGETFNRNLYLNEQNIEKLILEVKKALEEFIGKKDKYSLLVLGETKSEVDYPNLLKENYVLKKVINEVNDFSFLLSKLYSTNPKNLGWYKRLKKSIRYINGKDGYKELKFIAQNPNKKISILNLGITGLPVQYRDMKDKKNMKISPKLPWKDEDGRKTSVVRILISKSNNKYSAYALFLKSKITENDEVIVESDYTNQKTVVKIDQAKILEKIKELIKTENKS